MAKALGTHIANHLIDLHASTEEFRSRYLEGIRKAAIPWLFPDQQKQIVPASLGELSQAIGAALVGLYQSQKTTLKPSMSQERA